jgi:hypothetical protein
VCQANNWSLDITKIVAIGGTSADIADELRESFGNIVVLEDAQYCNVLGYLRMMCARIPEFSSSVIPIADRPAEKAGERKPAEKAREQKAS